MLTLLSDYRGFQIRLHEKTHPVYDFRTVCTHCQEGSENAYRMLANMVDNCILVGRAWRHELFGPVIGLCEEDRKVAVYVGYRTTALEEPAAISEVTEYFKKAIDALWNEADEFLRATQPQT